MFPSYRNQSVDLRERETERQRDRDRETERQRDRERSGKVRREERIALVFKDTKKGLSNAALGYVRFE